MHRASAQFFHQRSGLPVRTGPGGRLLSSTTQTMLQETSQCPFPYTSLLMNELFPALPGFTRLRRGGLENMLGCWMQILEVNILVGKGLLEMDFLY